MLSGLKNRFSSLRNKDSIVNKLENIKNIDSPKSSSHTLDSETIDPELNSNPEKLIEMQEETEKKISEMLDSKAEAISANAESIKSVEKNFSKMDISISTVKRSVEEYSDRFSKMEENILELLSLYEVVSNTVNPFVGDNENKPMDIEKYNAIENRMKNLEGSLEHFANLNQTDSHVTEEVLQRVRNELDEKLNEFSDKFAELESQKVQMDIITADPTQEISDSVPNEINETQVPQRSSNSPLLQNLDNKSETFIIILNWVEFLMEKVGRNNLIDVLDYYTEISWISEDVNNKILSYANGIDYYDEKPTWKLMSQDHTKSLLFIERINGKKIDMGAFNKVERDVDKVKHHTEPYLKL